MSPEELKGKRIAIPGTMTTAFLALKLFQPDFEHIVVPFDRIIEAVKDHTVDAGLIIHEGQLTFGKSGMQKILDLGEWWREETGLPLPLGGNAIRRALGPKLMSQVAAAIKQSIQHALDHREQALQYAMQFARDLDHQLADRFVGMYVNRRTLDYGEDGRNAIRELLRRGHEARIIPQRVKVDFVESFHRGGAEEF
jgi:1,4-dihydroxy-6-naphthoate synthase